MRNRDGAATVGSLAANPLQLLKMTRAMLNEARARPKRPFLAASQRRPARRKSADHNYGVVG
ncbi:hypothetical protein I550_5694 [Mycobacterium intracellulare 1956]|uniref:Uncharacterized protein n=1 Tax=Mycobacterium intracellulare 1956 TaxID=1299331 RepID=X8CD60_MYCIT|nr:hypothetical protein I548_2617 [Mycobacterium intracellulare]EUA54054.1 hypothetical protein I550_5694 [Mycobacterium intracellulare 1956]